MKPLSCDGLDQKPEAAQTQEADAAFGLEVKQVMEVGEVGVVKVGPAFEISPDAKHPEGGDRHGHPDARLSLIHI